MLEKAARGIVKARYWMLFIFLFLAIVCAGLISKTTINYDFTDYLSDDTVTRQALDIMEKEFGNTDQLTVMFENLEEGKIEELAAYFHAHDGVLRATHTPETDAKTADGVLYEKIEMFLDCPDAVAFVVEIQKELDERADVGVYHLSGTPAQTLNLQKSISKEVALAMIIAVAVVLAVLFISAHSYFEPIIFMLVLAVSILINMGTNWIFDSISFVTFAVAAILQLALAMDYSIMLLHNYFDYLKETNDKNTALVKALARSFMPVSSSALTTVAGLAALMFMSFTIGFDIGIVLAKGILISLLTVFLFMPALIYLFSGALEKTRHKPLPLGGGMIAAFAYRTRKIIAPVLILVIVFSIFVQKDNEYIFTDTSSNIESNRVSSVFGVSNQMVLLFPTGTSDEDLDRQRELVGRLEELTFNGKKAVTSVTSLVTTGEIAVKYYTLQEISELSGIPSAALGMYTGALGFGTVVRGDELVDKAADVMPKNEMIMELKDMLDFARSMFIGEEYARMILLMDIPYFGEEMYVFLDELEAVLREVYPDESVSLAGASMSTKDIAYAFEADTARVSLITIIAVFLIILISFRNGLIPAILVFVIQGAIWITMSYSTLAGEGIFFMSYLICTAIQMGATIDYGILLTSNYIRCRKTLPVREALRAAMISTMPTVFTSGIILIVAGFVIGQVCSVFYIHSIGNMLGRGALTSVVLVLTLLPQLLVFMDKLISGRNAFKEEQLNG